MFQTKEMHNGLNH